MSYYVMKQYRDFQSFDSFLKDTFMNDPDFYNMIPAFPRKKNQYGMKLTEPELQKLLEIYLNTILAKEEFNRLICVKTFLTQTSLQNGYDYQGG